MIVRAGRLKASPSDFPAPLRLCLLYKMLHEPLLVVGTRFHGIRTEQGGESFLADVLNGIVLSPERIQLGV